MEDVEGMQNFRRRAAYNLTGLYHLTTLLITFSLFFLDVAYPIVSPIGILL